MAGIEQNDWTEEAEIHAMSMARQRAAQHGIQAETLHDWMWLNMGYLHTMRRPGWETNEWWADLVGMPDVFVRAWVWLLTCTREASMQRYENGEPGVWWAVLVRNRPAFPDPQGGGRVMYLCPSLVQSNSRVWMVHTSRVVLASGVANDLYGRSVRTPRNGNL